MALDRSTLTEYEALTGGVGLLALYGRTLLAVTGADRVQFLQSFTTNDVKKLVAGTGCEAFVTNPQGKTLGHVLIFCEANQHWIDTSPGQAETLINHFHHYVITEDVQFTDRSCEFTDLLLGGPNALALLTSILEQPPPTEPLQHHPATIAGRPVTVRRVEFASGASYFVQTTAADEEAVAHALVTAGAVPCSSAALESARVEAGIPVFGSDITPENLPQEVARDAKAISFTKGCYLGQETVARIDAVGHVNRVLVGFKSAGQEIPASGTVLLAGDQPVGHVTSAAWSPRLAAPLALGYVRRTSAKPGTQLSSAAGAVEVVRLPLAST